MNKLVAISVSLVLGTLSCAAGRAACCYFAAKDKDILQPGQKAFITWNPTAKQETFTVQPKFEGNALDFGMVIPTPSRPKLDEMPRDFFKDLAIYTILMPLPEPIYSEMDPPFPQSAACASMLQGATNGMIAPLEKSTVRVLESGIVGSLDYKIIVAENAADLFSWLKTNKYSYSGDEATLNFYIKKKWYFTVMKIDSKQMKRGPGGAYTGEVTPTRFSFASTSCIYPLKITQISVKNRTDALFYVQAPQQMDLPGDSSWMHSYRPMYLTYMLGCCINPDQQKELDERSRWLDAKRTKKADYETTKLEWAKKLGPSEISVVNDPLKNYKQMSGDLPPGAKPISLQDMLAKLKAFSMKKNNGKVSDWTKRELARMEDQYQPSKGMIVENPKTANSGQYFYTHFTWYPGRDAPLDDIKGLVRLKGHLQQGQWLTKFRKQIRRDEMTDDLVLAAVPKEREQTYVRIMPTSPP